MSAPVPQPTIAWTSVFVTAVWACTALFLAGFALLAPTAMKPPLEVAIIVTIALVPLVLAAMLAKRLPRDPASALLAAAGGIFVMVNIIAEDALGAFEGTWMLLYLPFAILLLVVPTGRAQSARWRAVGWILTIDVALFVLVVATGRLRVEWQQVTDPITIPLLIVLLVCLCLCAAALIGRYRAADEKVRLQLRWVFLIGSALPLTLLLCWTSYLVWDRPDLVGVGLVIMYLAIPVGVYIALLHPTALDIDRVVVAVATAGLMAVVLLTVLTVLSLVMDTPLIRWPPVIAIVVTAALTVAAALCFRFLHSALDRLLYPERARTVTAIRRLASRVDRGLGTPEEVEQVLAEALRDPDTRVGVRRIGDEALVQIDGSPFGDASSSLPVRVRGEDIGVIAVSSGRVTRPARAIGHAAAPLLDAVRTRAALAMAMTELEASRERMLRAGYEERRRLERDLHDGAQQRLVALGMKLRVLQRTAGANEAVSASIDAAVAELGTAVAELRQLAHGVRPSALDDGLAHALSALVRHAPGVVEMDVRAPDLPDAIATTAYFVASEAVANALKHSGANRVHVIVRAENGALHVSVQDDGCGGVELRTSGGLTGLADRVQTLGGRLHVRSAPDEGTTVEAVLPCAS